MIRLFAAFTAFPTHEGILELKGRLLKDKLLPHITEELIQKLKKYTPTDYIISKGPYYGLFELTSQNPTPAVIRYQQVIADMDAYLKALKAKDNTFNSLNTEDLNENNKTGEDSIENFLSKLGDNSF